MLSMVEFDIEALFEIGRKTFDRRRRALHVRVTDGAHRHHGSKKLLSMAVHASTYGKMLGHQRRADLLTLGRGRG